MIVYGTRSSQLAKEMVPQKCTNCGTPNSVDLYLFQKYAHVFWIPFFPIGKTSVSQCNNCKQVLKQNEMPPALQSSYENLRKDYRPPVWMFAGLALVALLIIGATVADKRKNEKNAQLILVPRHGDVFEIKTKSNQYTLYRVQEVRGDSAYLQLNNYETNKMTGLAELKSKGDEAYSDELFSFSTAELKAMLEKGEIMNIERQ